MGIGAVGEEECPPERVGIGLRRGGEGRDRTGDTGFFRPVLYQLSYLTPAAPAGEREGYHLAGAPPSRGLAPGNRP